MTVRYVMNNSFPPPADTRHFRFSANRNTAAFFPFKFSVRIINIKLYDIFTEIQLWKNKMENV